MLEREFQGPFRALKPLILASESPRRQRLLASLGLSFFVRVSGAHEPDPLENEDPKRYAEQNAAAKAQVIASKEPGAVVIAADTIVVLDRLILNKPNNVADALRMLKLLNGREHEVITGCCLQVHQEQHLFSVITKVTMAGFSDAILKGYASCGEPMDKAGAYAIQGAGGFLIQSIQGSYSNVVGLPLFEITEALLNLSAIEPVQTIPRGKIDSPAVNP